MKVKDVAGNQGVQCGKITVPVEEKEEDAAPVVIVPTEPPAVAEAPIVEEVPPTPQLLAAPSVKGEVTPFTFGSIPKSPSETTPIDNNILWGATASAAIGAFAALIAERKRQEEEQKKKEAQEGVRRYNKLIKAYQQAMQGKEIKPKVKQVGTQSAESIRRYNMFKRLAREKAEQRYAEQQAQNKTSEKPSLREKMLGFKEKLLNPAPPPVEPSLVEVQKRMALEAQKDTKLDSATLHYLALGNAVANGEFSKEEYDKARKQAEENQLTNEKYQRDVLADLEEARTRDDILRSAAVGGEGTRDEWTKLEIKRAKEGVPWEMPEEEKPSLFERIGGWIKAHTVTREQDPINRTLEEEQLRRDQILAEQFEIENQYSISHPVSDFIRAGANEIENEKRLGTTYQEEGLLEEDDLAYLEDVVEEIPSSIRFPGSKGYAQQSIDTGLDIASRPGDVLPVPEEEPCLDFTVSFGLTNANAIYNTYLSAPTQTLNEETFKKTRDILLGNQDGVRADPLQLPNGAFVSGIDIEVRSEMVRIMIMRDGNTAYVSQVVQNEKNEWVPIPDSEFQVNIEDTCETEN